jgi:type I restriction enzyme S subunit
VKVGWTVKNLGETCRFIDYRGKTPEKTERGLRLITAKNVKMGFLQLHPMEFVHADNYERWMTRGIPQVGDVIFTTEAPLANIAQLDTEERVVFAQRVIVLHPTEPSLDPTFLKYLLMSETIQRRIRENGTGATVQGIKASLLKTLEISFPPLPEQTRIVGILDNTFDSISTVMANAEKNLHNARALFESYLQVLFTRRGKGWVDQQLGSLCREITVGHVGTMKTEYKENGIPFLRSQNIRPFEVSMDNTMFINEAFHRALKKSQLRPGDLAIVRTGYPGTAAVIPSELPDSNCSDLVIVRPRKELNAHFLAAFFNSAFGKELVLGKIVGAAQKHFNITAAKEVMLHVPPMPEQLAIVSKLDELRVETGRLASHYERKVVALEALKKSLLHEAFTGQL